MPTDPSESPSSICSNCFHPASCHSRWWTPWDSGEYCTWSNGTHYCPCDHFSESD